MFSLILCTLGRYGEVLELLESLTHQAVAMELIVVDQNEDDKLMKEVIRLYDGQNIFESLKYIKSEVKGLSRARNVGLAVATGNLVAFPDDDCVYSSGLLLCVERLLDESVDLVAAQSTDCKSDFVSSGQSSPVSIGCTDVFNTIISYTLFFRSEAIKGMNFDERMGVGAKFGSAEESDFVLRFFKAGGRGVLVSSLLVYHPVKIENFNDLERMKYYGLGVGAFYRKHLLTWVSFKFLVLFMRSYLGPLIATLYYAVRFDRLKTKWFGKMLVSRLKGFLLYGKGW